MSASGSSAIAGKGLNIDVSSSGRSVPMRVEMATIVSVAAQAMPSAYPARRIRSEVSVLPGSTPLVIASTNAFAVDENVGNSSGLPSQRAYASQINARSARSASLRTPPMLPIRCQADSGFSTMPDAAASTACRYRSNRCAGAGSAIRDRGCFDFVGKEQRVDLLLERARRAPIGIGVARHAVQLGFDLPRVWREEEDPAADADRFGNRM